VIAALGIIGLGLLQHGKGADMGAAFGSGSSGSVFGSAGSANFMSRTTAILAVIFFISSIGLTVVGSKKAADKGFVTGIVSGIEDVLSEYIV
jgi:preprotein translocase subunit SecG